MIEFKKGTTDKTSQQIAEDKGNDDATTASYSGLDSFM